MGAPDEAKRERGPAGGRVPADVDQTAIGAVSGG